MPIKRGWPRLGIWDSETTIASPLCLLFFIEFFFTLKYFVVAVINVINPQPQSSPGIEVSQPWPVILEEALKANSFCFHNYFDYVGF